MTARQAQVAFQVSLARAELREEAEREKTWLANAVGQAIHIPVKTSIGDGEVAEQ
jgi:hypothetical protein